MPLRLREELKQSGIDVEREDVRKTVTILAQSQQLYAGPIPPADMLEGYERVRPGLAAEIIGWTQQQQAHRRGLELRVTRGAEQRMNRSQVFGLIVAISGIAGTIVLGIYGNPWAAAVLAAASIGGPSAATVIARWIAPMDQGPGRARRAAPPEGQGDQTRAEDR